LHQNPREETLFPPSCCPRPLAWWYRSHKELATTILTVAPLLKDADAAFGKEVTAIARKFVDGVKGGLPQGVELEEFQK